VLTTIFIYWGWDATVTVNEETKDSARTPDIGALLSTLILLAVYLGVATAAQAYHGTHFLAANQTDVLGALGKAVLSSPWDKLLIIAVLTSASASTQTTILPAARTVLSMSAHGAPHAISGGSSPATRHPAPRRSGWAHFRLSGISRSPRRVRTSSPTPSKRSGW
jgi:amino acid transporter